MPTAQQLRERLIKKLRELFQLNQPDLDFGFYRIMHVKSEQVAEFIDKDLLKIVRDAFGQVDEARKAGLKAKIQEEIEKAKEYGVPDPENSPKVKEAEAEYNAVKDTASAESDIYDHLYRFFERYYDDGDFISRRYYTRETSGKAAPYAIPYNGEEVKLHWANADQYYIKTAEYFTNFTFDLTQAAEIRKLTKEERVLQQIPDHPLKVHFRIVDATEGEHGNVKTSDANKRFFIIHAEKPVDVTEDGELVINFEYRPDPEKTGQEKSWREKRNAEAVETVLDALEHLVGANTQVRPYIDLLKFPAPTEKDKKRPLLAKYVNQYTARNTMDYFIHKDLGGFLRRELDFYIKNEVMRLDDIENATAPAVESYLAKIKVLRKIAGKLIDFLAQLEDFQKKLWLKKKFVVETNYCVTIDRVPEELYPEIAANDAQREEWVKLFAIDEIKGDLSTPGYSDPLTVEFLKANDKLVLDTRFFGEEFKARLIASLENIDEQCDGLLINAENAHALRLLNESYRSLIRVIYIDPPFNLGTNGDFLYKTNYKDSSWLCMLEERISYGRHLLNDIGMIYLRCDDHGNHLVRLLCDQIFGADLFQYELSVQRIRKNVTGQGRISLPLANDSLFLYFKTEKSFLVDPFLKLKKKRGEYWRRIDDSAGFRNPPERIIFGKKFLPYKHEAHFKYSQVSIDRMIEQGRIRLKCKNCGYEHYLGDWTVCPQCGQKDATPQYKVEATDKKILDTNWMDIPGYSSTTGFSTENSEALLDRVIQVSSAKGDLILDFFAGSGTTLAVAQAKGRKWIGIEIGHQFDKYIIPRLQKTIAESKDGGYFKYLRLESYEDTLNNMQLGISNIELSAAREKFLQSNPSLREDYMLHYLLDVETRGSQSLLNIDAFADPCSYKLKVKKPGSDEYIVKDVDLIETFNYLIGLRVIHIAAPQTFTAAFKRNPDPELPEDQHTKLVVDGKIRQDAHGPWWFRKIEGWVPKGPTNPNNGQREKVLVVWRKLTGDMEKDNLMLDEWFQKNRINTRDFEFNTIYVNGSNNLPNLKLDEENWKVRLIEEEFMKRMWEVDK